MTDVTSKVGFGDNDGEHLPLIKCMCGEKFGWWEQVLTIYEGMPWTCPKCGVKLTFKVSVQVFQL